MYKHRKIHIVLHLFLLLWHEYFLNYYDVLKNVIFYKIAGEESILWVNGNSLRRPPPAPPQLDVRMALRGHDCG